ncbi:MAG: type II toxin-antitoxin system antitoxin SocA domain-containing protein [Planctomycetota bacterium]
MQGDTRDIKALANTFLEEAQRRNMNDLSPMKLQKLVYFAHGWQLALTGKPLVDEDVQAWRFGPVIYPLYRAFKRWGDQPIAEPAFDLSFEDGTFTKHTPLLEQHDEVRGLVRRVLDVYGRFNAIQLSNMTHDKGSPWDRISEQFGGNIPPGVDIPNELIRDYFTRQLAPAS